MVTYDWLIDNKKDDSAHATVVLKLVGDMGLEPMASCMSRRHSNQLS